MKKIGLMIFILFWAHSSFANGTVDELNALLSKKERALHPINQAVEASQNHLSEHYYFVFIYKGSCPHCHQFAPVLKDFADNFHMHVKAYRLDNDELPDFKAEPLTPELFQSLYVAGAYKPTVPALFLVNRHTGDTFAVLFGEAKPYELANRMSELMKHIEDKYHD